jgi:hypothetical protein
LVEIFKAREVVSGNYRQRANQNAFSVDDQVGQSKLSRNPFAGNFKLRPLSVTVNDS